MLPLEYSFVWNETRTLQKIDQKYVRGAGEWWKRSVKAVRVKNEEILQGVKEERSTTK